MLACCVVLWLQRSTALRSLFQLPWPPALIAVPAAGLAWWIVMHCRHRPGGLFPRLCTLTIASAAAAIALWAMADGYFVPGARPLVHALTVGSLFATLLLSLRLARVRPSGWLLHKLTFLGLLFVLVLGLLVTPALETRAVGAQSQRIGDYRGELAAFAATVHEVRGFKWAELAANVPGANQQVARLKSLRVPSWIADQRTWKAAAILGEEKVLAEAVSLVMLELRDSLIGAGAPKLAAVESSYNPTTRSWESYREFDQVSAAVAGYYRECARLQEDLGERLASLEAMHDIPGLGPAHEVHSEEIKAWQSAVERELTRRWLGPLTRAGGSPPTVLDTLRLRLPGSAGEASLSMAHLGGLMALSKDDAEKLAQDGCAGSRYAEDGYDYYRVDCHGYELSSDQARAQLQVQLRLVYRAPVRRALTGGDAPYQLYYLFPVRADAADGAEGLQQRAMLALFQAVSEVHQPKPTTPRGRPPTDGFTLNVNGETLRVMRSRTVRGLNAVDIQVFRDEVGLGRRSR